MSNTGADAVDRSTTAGSEATATVTSHDSDARETTRTGAAVGPAAGTGPVQHPGVAGAERTGAAETAGGAVAGAAAGALAGTVIAGPVGTVVGGALGAIGGAAAGAATAGTDQAEDDQDGTSTVVVR
ncbi:MAG: hypothetical protein AVDCRST_MAG77-2789 [uncultured Chloroflexi bacterium]|uniref:Glycine zipper domain-containing protein n=1 Tax=uncultured Chloroflexota bacterium TaxID=166587 RepID=A0A6J4J2G2_9CHLR|nr:MAG: hypothetical protein AVDCRST_MAG77-2789 [uncultured Chloroflexota bacterium]